MIDLFINLGYKMRVKLEPETAFIGKKFGYIFLGIIFGLNSIVFVWYFFFSNLTLSQWIIDYYRSWIISAFISFVLVPRAKGNSSKKSN